MTDVAQIRDQIVALLPRLRRFCQALAGSADAGDDLAQATVERALSRLDQWQHGTRLDSWMYRIAQNLRIDAARTAQRRGVHVGVEALEQVMGVDGRAVMEARSEYERTRLAVAALPEEQRLVVALVLIDGHSYQEAAEIAGVPIGTIMSRLARARQAISRAVHGPGGQEQQQ